MIFEGPILEKVIEDYIIGKFDKDEFESLSSDE